MQTSDSLQISDKKEESAMEKALLSVIETTEYLGLGLTKTRELIRREPFGCKIGNRWYSNRLLLEKWLEEQCRKKSKIIR